MLLPLIGFSQTDLVRWSTDQSNTPSYTSNVSSTNLTPSTGVGNGWSGNIFTGFPTAQTADLTKYFSFTLTSTTSSTINVTDVQYQTVGGCAKYIIGYSKDATFTTGVTYTTEKLTNGAFETLTISGVSLALGEKLHVRFYGYSRNNNWDEPWGVVVGGTNYLRVRGNIVLGAPLTGTYTIGTGAVTTTNFTTITSAVSALNSRGVSGPVTFLLNNALYNEAAGESFPIIINQFAGSSATNTVTFKPNTGKNVIVKVNDITINWNNYQATTVFKFHGADNIIFDGSNTANGNTRNLTVFNNNTEGSRARTVFWVASTADNNGATNITIKNTNIRQGSKNQGEQFCVGVYSGNYTTSGTINDHAILVQPSTANNAGLTVSSNDFVNVKQGVYINGSSTIPTTNVVVTKNDLGAENNQETIIQPACFSNVNGFEYSENYINNLYRENDNGNLLSAGIYIIGNTKNGSIIRNTMIDITRTVSTGTACFSGIALSSSEANANIVVANNFISNVSSAGTGAPEQNGYGIFLNSGGGYKIYNNTVDLTRNNLTTDPAVVDYSAAVYVAASVSGFDIRNNIFVNNQTRTNTRRSAIMINKSAASISNNSDFALNYNNYSSSDRIGYIGTAANNANDAGYIATFPVWKSTTGKDAQSTNIIPVFASATDLHIDFNNAQNNALNGTATPLTAVTKDIDGQVRNTTTPDMGADEWGALIFPSAGNNAGIYCDSATTWNGTAWNNGTPNSAKDAIFSGNYTQNGGTFEACSVFILPGANVNFISNSTAIVQHSVNVDNGATLTFESSSNLIQTENDKNTGVVTIKRKSGLLKRLDYTMWTAPITDTRGTGYQSMQAFSPLTSITRFYEFNTALNQYSAVAAPGTTKFSLGKGYLIRMPNAINGSNTNPYFLGQQRIQFEGAFQGTPNNGTIRVPLAYNAGETFRYNAVGNPYPSPISVKDFINQNLDVIDGTLYFWRKTNDITQTTYSIVNLTGYVANNAPGGGGTNGNDGNELINDPYAIDANIGVLNTAQGFIVKATAPNKELVFRNNMRVNNHSNYFFRTMQDENANENAATEGRMWINVTTASGDFTQAIVAYNPLTSLDYDNGYDGKTLASGNIGIYSLMTAQDGILNLSIQSRGAFTPTDKVALGFKAQVGGTFTLAFDHIDGLFNQDVKVLLVDKLTGVTHNLKSGSYVFESEIGTFDNRFEIVYASQEETQLGIDTPVADVKQLVVYSNNKQISVQAPADIKAVSIYDITGKVLYTNNNIEGTEFSTTAINATQQMLVVQITLSNQQVVSKKIMMN